MNFLRIVLNLLMIYLIASPFYLWSSGLPQLADFILVLALLIFFMKFPIKIDTIFIILFVLALLILVVNGVWSIIIGNSMMNMNTIYFIYNFLILIMVLSLLHINMDLTLKYVKYGVMLSLAFQFISLLVLGDFTGSRQTIFFNNPNQLGYYGLLILSFLVLLFYSNHLKLINFIFLLVLSIYLILISLSTAAIIGAAIIIIILMQQLIFKKLKGTNKLTFLILLMSFLILIQFSNYLQDSPVINNVNNRLESREYDTGSNFHERRYDRLTDHPEYLILGAGQGGVERFARGGEIHASLAAFLFSYGIFGVILLLILFYKLIHRPTIITIFILLAVHFYGLTHQGLREPLFWMLIGIIYIFNKEKLSIKNLSNQS